MAQVENPYAGQGPVLLDIGGQVGALVVHMPESMEGVEVEIRPRGATVAETHHGHEEAWEAGAHHVHGARHAAYPHVAVVGRPDGTGTTFALVFAEVTQGAYELVPLLDGRVALTATVTGGSVTYATWPAP